MRPQLHAHTRARTHTHTHKENACTPITHRTHTHIRTERDHTNARTRALHMNRLQAAEADRQAGHWG